MILQLPYPPSVNTYWRHPTKGKLAGRHLISEEGRKYRSLVAGMMAGADMLTGRLSVTIGMYPPDKRRRDVDNILKSVLDSLGHAGIYEDDSQIDELRVTRRDVERPSGRLEVTIREINQ